jgi:hypothetical protein
MLKKYSRRYFKGLSQTYLQGLVREISELLILKEAVDLVHCVASS